jgi:hypothetical protein
MIKIRTLPQMVLTAALLCAVPEKGETHSEAELNSSPLEIECRILDKIDSMIRRLPAAPPGVTSSEAKPNPSRLEIECQSRKLRDNIDSAKSNFGRRFDKTESAPNEEVKAISQLFKMSDDLGALEDAIDPYGIVPLMILKRQLKAAQNSLLSKGLGNIDTMYQYLALVLMVESLISSGYFKYAPSTQKDAEGIQETVNDINETVKDIAAARGFSINGDFTKPVYSRYGEILLKQLVTLINQLTPYSRSKIRTDYLPTLLPPLGNAIAEAELGDDLESFRLGTEAVCKVEKLFSMDQNNQSNTELQIMKGIMTLVYGYKHYASIKQCPSGERSK